VVERQLSADASDASDAGEMWVGFKMTVTTAVWDLVIVLVV
jgi:hypothetical protein